MPLQAVAPMPLPDTTIRNAKPADKARKLFDGGGLYLDLGRPKRGQVVAAEVPLREQGEAAVAWRLPRCFPEGRPRAPRRGAQAAGQRHRPQRAPPGAEDREGRPVANSFEVVAREWHAKHLRSWTDKRAETIIRRLELNVLPWLGGKPVADVTAPQLL